MSGHDVVALRALKIGDKQKKKVYPARDHFAPELLYFSDCVLKDLEPEPSGKEGLADVRVLRAVERSAAEGRSVKLAPYARAQRPTPSQEIHRPAHKKAELINVQEPSA